MLDVLFEKSYVIIKLPPQLQKIKYLIEDKAKEWDLEVIDLSAHVHTDISHLPTNVKGVFLYNDNRFETGILISYLVKTIPKVYLLSEEDIAYQSNALVVYNPKYKKLAETIDLYLQSISSDSLNFIIDQRAEGFSYQINGEIKINPYKGLFVSLDHPNMPRKYGWGGTLLAESIVNELDKLKIPYIFEYEPTNELFGGIAKSVLRGKLALDPDALQLLYIIDRIDHTKTIYQALKEGKLVLLSRYVLSTLAYAYKDLPIGFLVAANAQVYWPDINFIVQYENTDLAVSLMKRKIQVKERFDYGEKQSQVNEALLYLGETFKGITHLLEGKKSIESLTKTTLRIMRNHPKFKQYIVNSF